MKADTLPKAMLSAFTARPVVELKPRDKSKIESVLAYGTHRI
jgi:6-phosphofructo-2-kinase/fructose-2,6-biphosphatase 2